MWKKQNKRPIYYMGTFIVMAIGLTIFLVGFLLGTFVEGIRSNVLMMQMEQQLQQQHIDQQIKAITDTNLLVRDEESTKDMPRYRDEY